MTPGTALGVERSSKYTTLSAANSMITSFVAFLTASGVTVTACAMSKILKQLKIITN